MHIHFTGNEREQKLLNSANVYVIHAGIIIVPMLDKNCLGNKNVCLS